MFNKVCPLAWFQYSISPNTASPCCWTFLKSFDIYQGDWNGNKLINDIELINFRKDLLRDGRNIICKNTVCPYIYTQNQDIVSLFPSIKEKSKKLIQEYSLLIQDTIQKEESFINYFPGIIHLTISYKCNSNCLMCRFGSDEYNKIIPTINQYMNLKEYIENCFHLNISGGEFFSLSNNEIESFLSIINSDRTSVGVATNLSLLNIERYDKFVNNGPIDLLYCSLDSLKPEVYKFLRKTDFFFLIKNIDKIVSKYSKHKIDSFIFAISSMNYKEMFDVVKFSHDIGVRYLTFMPIFNYNIIGAENEYLDIFRLHYSEKIHKEILEQIEKINDFSKKNNFIVCGLETVKNSFLISQ